MGARNQQKGKGQGKRRQLGYRHWSHWQLKQEHRRLTPILDKLTYQMQEGKLSNGQVLTRPFRPRGMWVGLVLAGFGGAWIMEAYCEVCQKSVDIARCVKCHAGICKDHGMLAGRSSQNGETRQWQGASIACSKDGVECKRRQREVLARWVAQTGKADV